MDTAAATAPSSSTTLETWKILAERTSRRSRVLGIDSCSLRKATSEPQNDTDPMIAANSDRPQRDRRRLFDVANPSVSMNSAHAISATVPPPTPLNSATSCGIAVILVFFAGAPRGAPRWPDRPRSGSS